MSDDADSSSEAEQENSNKDDNGILQEAIDAAEEERAKESPKKRRRKAVDGEWLPPLLQRQKDRVARVARKKSNPRDKEEYAGQPIATAPLPPPPLPAYPTPTTYARPYGYSTPNYPIMPTYYNPAAYPQPYYPYPYPYSQPFPTQAPTAVLPAGTTTTTIATTTTTEENKGGDTQGENRESGKEVDQPEAEGEAVEDEAPQETAEGDGEEDTEKESTAEPVDSETEQTTPQAVSLPVAAAVAPPLALPFYSPTYNPAIPRYPYPSYPMAAAPPMNAYARAMADPRIAPNPYAKPPPLVPQVSTTTAAATATAAATTTAAEKKKEEELPPFLEGLKVMYPKKAELTIDAIKKAEGGALQYEETNYHAMHQNGIRNMAEHLDYILYTGSRGNCRNAAAILQSLLRRPNLEAVKQHMAAKDVQSKESKEQARKEQRQLTTAKTDAVIVQGIKDFLHSHRTSSLRRKHEHDAVEAVLTAACSAGKVIYGRRDPKRRARTNSHNNNNNSNNNSDPGKSDDDEEEEGEGEEPKEDRRGKTGMNPRWGITQDTYNKEEFPLEKVAKRLNKPVDEITRFRNELAGKPFVPRKQKTQEDYYRENPIGACVLEFCHSIESSWPASKNEEARSAFRPVKNPITGEREEHRVRVWHEEAVEDRYADFLQSNAYRSFLATQHENNRNNPRAQNEITSINFESFCKAMCPCVLDCHPKGKDRKRKKPDLPLARNDLENEEDLALYNRW